MYKRQLHDQWRLKQATNLEYSGISFNMENLGNSVQPQAKTVTVTTASSHSYWVTVLGPCSTKIVHGNTQLTQNVPQWLKFLVRDLVTLTV